MELKNAQIFRYWETQPKIVGVIRLRRLYDVKGASAAEQPHDDPQKMKTFGGEGFRPRTIRSRICRRGWYWALFDHQYCIQAMCVCISLWSSCSLHKGFQGLMW